MFSLITFTKNFDLSLLLHTFPQNIAKFFSYCLQYIFNIIDINLSYFIAKYNVIDIDYILNNVILLSVIIITVIISGIILLANPSLPDRYIPKERCNFCGARGEYGKKCPCCRHPILNIDPAIFINPANLGNNTDKPYRNNTDKPSGDNTGKPSGNNTEKPSGNNTKKSS